MLYGSQQNCTEMLPCDRSHQLGEGQLSTTGMSGVVHPPLLVYGSQGSDAEMPMRDCSQGEGQTMHAEMPMPNCPSRLVYGSQSHGTEMSHLVRSHQFTGAFVTTQQCPSMIAPTYLPEAKHQLQKCYLKIASQGEGHSTIAAMPSVTHPSRPVYGSHTSIAAMLARERSHQFWAVVKTQQCQAPVA